MTALTIAQLHYFTKITKFLGSVLGPDYEVALHDVSNRDGALVAISNSYISGRKIGDPLPDSARDMIAERRYETDDFVTHYFTTSPTRKVLRSSTMFIKDRADVLVGTLCINFDDTRYRDLSQKVFRLCHPDAFVDTNFDFDQNKMKEKEHTESAVAAMSTNDSSIPVMIENILAENNIVSDILTYEEKIIVVTELNRRGAFLVKGAIKEVADIIGSSPASVYRYLSHIKEQG